MIKRMISGVFVIAMVLSIMLSITACGENKEGKARPEIPAADIRIGVILTGDNKDEDSFVHIDGVQKAAYMTGVNFDRIIWKYSVGKGEECYNTAVELVNEGCNLIIATHKGYQSYIQKAAGQFEDTMFIAVSGVVCFKRLIHHDMSKSLKTYKATKQKGATHEQTENNRTI